MTTLVSGQALADISVSTKLSSASPAVVTTKPLLPRAPKPPPTPKPLHRFRRPQPPVKPPPPSAKRLIRVRPKNVPTRTSSQDTCIGDSENADVKVSNADKQGPLSSKQESMKPNKSSILPPLPRASLRTANAGLKRGSIDSTCSSTTVVNAESGDNGTNDTNDAKKVNSGYKPKLITVHNHLSSMDVWKMFNAQRLQFYHRYLGPVSLSKHRSKKRRDLNVIEKEIIQKLALRPHPGNKDGVLYLPMNYGLGAKSVETLPDDPFKIVYGIEGMDTMVSKKGLWVTLVESYGAFYASQLIPRTMVIGPNLKNEVASLPNDTIMILKKDLQRQRGLKLITAGEIKSMNWSHLGEYLVTQQFLPNPMLVSGRKINFRVYMLVVMRRRTPKYEVYIYNDGFLYYTPKPYVLSLDPAETITTGYIDRQVYVENPLTRQQLYAQLPPQISKTIEDNIAKTIAEVMKPFAKVFRNRFMTTFQLFGVDVQPNHDYSVNIIEINKSPDMSPKDERDAALKNALQWDVWTTALKGTPLEFTRPDTERQNGFVKVL